MVRRSVQFLVLGSLLYWASGLAHYAHERMEQGDRAAAVESAGWSFAAAGHNPDDCPVCQVLATMRADSPGTTIVLPATFDLVGSYVPLPQAAPECERLLTLQSRAPPILGA